MTTGAETAPDASPSADRRAAEMEGPVALPRSNGELVFEQPWESRAFGAAIALSEGEAFEWESFRQSLIAEIGAWESDNGEGRPEDWSYYERWLAALERLLLERGILSAEEIEARAQKIADDEEHEHDHDHDHDHDGGGGSHR